MSLFIELYDQRKRCLDGSRLAPFGECILTTLLQFRCAIRAACSFEWDGCQTIGAILGGRSCNWLRFLHAVHDSGPL